MSSMTIVMPKSKTAEMELNHFVQTVNSVMMAPRFACCCWWPPATTILRLMPAAAQAAPASQRRSQRPAGDAAAQKVGSSSLKSVISGRLCERAKNASLFSSQSTGIDLISGSTLISGIDLI